MLEKRVHQAAEQLAGLRQEKNKLLSELKFLEDESKKNHQVVQKYDVWKQEKKAIAVRVEKLLKRITVLEANEQGNG